MLFFGAFIVRYRFELALAFPLVAIIMAIYLNLGFRPNSPAEHPERLYREPVLMAAVIVCAVLMTVLVFADLPWIRDLFTPSIDPQ
jgi:decaprenyl-phosphate phosphoribosyltransferase